jgi:hypothetical protein
MFGLFNGDGVRQDEVPPDVAVDSTIPAPHTRRLQAAIGCIRCHGTDGSDGWKPLQNDVKTLLSGKLDLLGDLTQRNRIASDVLDRLSGLYQGDFAKNLRRARDDVAEVTLKATGPWPDAKDQTDAAKVAAVKVADEYAAYNYDLVDAQSALRELGIDAGKSESLQLIGMLLPPDERAAFADVILEDPRIAALKAGLGINRSDWALVYGFAAERAQKNLAMVEKWKK